MAALRSNPPAGTHARRLSRFAMGTWKAGNGNYWTTIITTSLRKIPFDLHGREEQETAGTNPSDKTQHITVCEERITRCARRSSLARLSFSRVAFMGQTFPLATPCRCHLPSMLKKG